MQKNNFIFDFTHMWELRNSTDEHRGREGKDKNREANYEIL